MTLIQHDPCTPSALTRGQGGSAKIPVGLSWPRRRWSSPVLVHKYTSESESVLSPGVAHHATHRRPEDMPEDASALAARRSRRLGGGGKEARDELQGIRSDQITLVKP